jgi:hypothetical protein
MNGQELVGCLFEGDPLTSLFGVKITARQSMLDRIKAIGEQLTLPACPLACLFQGEGLDRAEAHKSFLAA